MAHARDDILDWVRQERIAPHHLRAALEAGGVLPTADAWRRFLDHLLLFMSVVLLAAGMIFFLAFNWRELGRFAKFGLVEVPILAVLVLVWRLGLASVAGKAALLLASLLTGALLALVGQTYQTGADTFELFAAWAAAILPWALLARFPALWLFWLALVNLAVALYFITFGLWGLLFAPPKLAWLLFGVNTTALVLWEGLATAGIVWLRERWAVRLLATASGGLITALAVLDVMHWYDSSPWSIPLWFCWLVAAYTVYRRWLTDLYVLAGGVLAVIVMTVSVLRKLMGMGEAASSLFIGLVVIGLSAAGGYWLRHVANEEKA